MPMSKCIEPTIQNPTGFHFIFTSHAMPVNIIGIINIPGNIDTPPQSFFPFLTALTVNCATSAIVISIQVISMLK